MRILALILISLSAFGQSEKKDVAVTLELLIEYKKYCYNDSTLTDYYADPNVTYQLPGGGYVRTSMGGYFEKRYLHRVPTFDGFIIWIEEKYR